MDPFTHGIVGLGVGALSNLPLSPYNPVYGAALLGAIAPDLDVVAMLKGDLYFIRNHRGATHSLAGFIVLSAAIAGLFFLDYRGNPLVYFFWAMAGAISHGILDSLNSYGTLLFWPFSPKRYAGNLLMFFDPFLIFLFLPVFFSIWSPNKVACLSLGLTGLYLLLRLIIRMNVEKFLRNKFSLPKGKIKLSVLPALRGIANWDFFIEAPREMMFGTLNLMGLDICRKQSLPKSEHTPVILQALQTIPGKFFSQFTSLYHIKSWKEKNKHIVKFIDLRFKDKSDFFYKLTMVFNEQLLLEKAYFHRLGETLPVNRLFQEENSNTEALAG